MKSVCALNKKRIIVLGCTGSIGHSALDIIRCHPERYEVVGLCAHTKKNELSALAAEFHLDQNVALLTSENSVSVHEMITRIEADIVLNGIAGSDGLAFSVTTLNSAKDLALANKETIVTAGSLIKNLAQEKKCRIMPVDSEHSAVFQLIEHFGRESVAEIILTASGGPFRTWTCEQILQATRSDALCHPTWNMGKKITVDSASLANKGLEVIEACFLFDMPPELLTVTIHPESLVHSCIRTRDGQLYMQMSKPDMKHPIITAFDYPDIKENILERTFFDQLINMSFSPPRFDDFPLLPLAYECATKQASYPIAYNAANEVAVAAFLNDKIPFYQIASIVESVLQHDWTFECMDFGSVYEQNTYAHRIAEAVVCNKK